MEPFPDVVIGQVFCILASGKADTMYAPRWIIVGCLLTTPRLRTYQVSQALGRMAVTVHAVVLGMANLVSQLLAVAGLALAMTCLIFRIGCDEVRIGRFLCVNRTDLLEDCDRRAPAYTRMDLTTSEETVVKWSLFPQRSDQV
jgi:hypothetical protein